MGVKRPSRILVSPYLRARQTAEPLVAKFPGTVAEEFPIQEFTYLDSAKCVNLDARGRKPLVDAYWSRLDPYHRDGVGAKTFVDLMNRAATFLTQAETWPGFTVAFTHEQFIRAVLLILLNGGTWHSCNVASRVMRRFHGLRVGLASPNTGIIRLDWRDSCLWIARAIDQS